MTFNEQVKTKRAELGVSRKYLAVISKTSVCTIRAIERNERNSAPHTIARINEALRYIERNKKVPAAVRKEMNVFPVKTIKLTKEQIEHYRNLPDTRTVYVDMHYWSYEEEHDRWRNEVFER